MRIVLCDMEAEQGLGLSKKSHALAKPLWMQRTFTQASGASLPTCTQPKACNTSSWPKESSAQMLSISAAALVQCQVTLS